MPPTIGVADIGLLPCSTIDHDLGPQSVNQDDLLGQCILAMRDVLREKESGFILECQLIRNGVGAGKIQLEGSLLLPGDDGHEAEVERGIQERGDKSCCCLM